eukprot:56050-Eustigmatos_ZCMA.PRE.1
MCASHSVSVVMTEHRRLDEALGCSSACRGARQRGHRPGARARSELMDIFRLSALTAVWEALIL